METLTLIYENGRMTLNLQEFFPCKIDTARKVFPLIRKCVSEDDRDALMDYLMGMYGEERNDMKDYKERADRAGIEKNIQKQKYYMAQYHKADGQQKRFKRNIELLVGGGKGR